MKKQTCVSLSVGLDWKQSWRCAKRMVAVLGFKKMHHHNVADDS